MPPIHSPPALLVLALALFTAQAQTPKTGNRPDPLDPAAAVPPPDYVSSLRPDRRAAPDKPLSWREANDTVARIGGWRAYTREARQPEPAPAAASAPAASHGHVQPAKP